MRELAIASNFAFKHNPSQLCMQLSPFIALDQYEAMAELARTIQGKMVISINDHDTIRKVFKGLSNKSLNINYTVGGNHKNKPSRELLIWNW